MQNSSMLLAIGYLLFAGLAWRRLSWAVLFVVAALPSYLIRFHIGPIPTTLLEGMLLIVIIAAVFHRFRKVRAEITPARNYKTIISETFNYPLRSSLTLPLAFFLLAATISLFVAPDLRAAAGIWKAYFIEPVLFFVILLDLLIHHPNLLNRRQIIGALSISALLLSSYAIFQRFTGFGIPPPWDRELRVTSIFPYPNALALFLGPLVPLFVIQSLAFVLRRGQKPSFYRVITSGYWLLATVLSLTAIIFAKSTGALVGVIAGFLLMGVIWVLRGKAHDRELFHARRFYARITIVVLAVLAAFTVLAPPSLKDELLLRNWPGHVRRTQWTETIAMLKDRPIFGAGLASYKETLAPYHKATYLEIFEYPHNIVLNFWSETGLLGLIALIWLVVVFFRAVIPPLKIRGGRGSYEPIAIASMASMVVILIHGLVDVPYFKNDLSMLFWIILALGLTPRLKRTSARSAVLT